VASEIVKESIVADADVDTIMDIVADLEQYPQWQEGVREVEILETDDDGWATKARLVVQGVGMTSWMVITYTYTDNAMSWRLVESDKLAKSDGSYTMNDRGDGTTEVIYELEVAPSISLPGVVRRQIARKIVDNALKGLQSRLSEMN